MKVKDLTATLEGLKAHLHAAEGLKGDLEEVRCEGATLNNRSSAPILLRGTPALRIPTSFLMPQIQPPMGLATIVAGQCQAGGRPESDGQDR